MLRWVNLDVLGDNENLLTDGLTIVRIRAQIAFWLEVVTTIGDGFASAAFGMCVVNENAFGVGLTAIPDPIGDSGWDGWMVYQALAPIMGFSVTESENTGIISQFRMDIDSKAMRKFKESDVLVGVLSVDDEVGAATLTWGLQSRILVKLA